MMFRIFINNLTKNQKIVALVMVQILVIILLISLFRIFTDEKTHVDIVQDETSGENISMPNRAKNFIEQNIWQVVMAHVPNVTSDNIQDVIIRDGSYQESITDDGTTQVSFIVDIDSLKQTYTVKTGWTKDGQTVYEVIVDCPPQDQMKYPETICYGMYNNTYSLDLYLPYIIYPDDADDSEEPLAPNIMITGDEYDKTIDVMISDCDADGFKKSAMDYLNSTPIELEDYTINYEINNINIRC